MSEIQKHWHIYLIGIGSVMAWSGITFYGMGLSYRESRALDVNAGLVLTVLGLVLLAVGIAAYMRRPDSQR